MLLLRKTPLNPTTQITSLLRITSRFFSMHIHRNPRKIDDDEPSSAYYDELITNAGLSGDLTTLHRLFNKRYKDGCFNTSNTFKFLAETDTDITTDLDDLLHILSNLDKGFARKNAFDCLIAHLCKINNIDESLRVIDTMIEKEIGVKACTFHPLLNSLTRKKCFEEAWLILAKMREIGIHIDVEAYNHILTAYCVNGDLMEASMVMEKILEDGLNADSKTYDALVMGACRVGKVEGALVLLRKMEDSGLPTLYSTHAHVIKSLVGLGCFAQGLEFVMAFGGRNKGLDTENFGYLLSCLVRRKRVEEAKLVFGEMEERGLPMGNKLRSEFEKLLSNSETRASSISSPTGTLA
ncbi:Pentatricopeptide repeat-containing protein [Thalictrum thalictroides]|uniref:Pentatricopeptide repeat-containing protein n=1 Tax=Thalictrum thalictroides TaxID=46969 RepID=A0A7J6VEL0_THATH|nr:Pentatricopeptide repeat-containing protein [Thalictrum thalictroides]